MGARQLGRQKVSLGVPALSPPRRGHLVVNVRLSLAEISPHSCPLGRKNVDPKFSELNEGVTARLTSFILKRGRDVRLPLQKCREPIHDTKRFNSLATQPNTNPVSTSEEHNLIVSCLQNIINEKEKYEEQLAK